MPVMEVKTKKTPPKNTGEDGKLSSDGFSRRSYRNWQYIKLVKNSSFGKSLQDLPGILRDSQADCKTLKTHVKLNP